MVDSRIAVFPKSWKVPLTDVDHLDPCPKCHSGLRPSRPFAGCFDVFGVEFDDSRERGRIRMVAEERGKTPYLARIPCGAIVVRPVETILLLSEDRKRRHAILAGSLFLPAGASAKTGKPRDPDLSVGCGSGRVGVECARTGILAA